MNAIIEDRRKRTEWFLNDRFGMFIHWGLYAVPARGEWVRSIEKISSEEYQKYFDEFNPVRYDPKKWAKVAKEAGMKYAVMTAKHHDGFCLFDSKLTDYKATNTIINKDLIKEYVDAFRSEGLKVGFYYSLLDWHHEHYPAFGDRIHPMRENESYKDQGKELSKYIDYLHGQVKELLTNYGKIDIIWFDFSYDNMTGETWRATELVNMARSLQPDIIIDNRLDASGEYGGSIKSKNPNIYSGDFASPEQVIPPEGVVDEEGCSIPWEACITLNNHWGYDASDMDYKSAGQIVKGLVECVSKNGNLLLNVGPDAKGEIPEKSLQVLADVGKWMHMNSESIYGAARSEQVKPEWGRFTQNGKRLFAHVYERGIGPTCLKGLNGKIKKARLLADGSEIKLERPWNTQEFPDDAFIDLKGQQLPDEKDTVIELELLDYVH
jgi:alpha-L-fucosidase